MTLPAFLAAPGFITKNAFSGGDYGQGNFMPRTTLRNQGTLLQGTSSTAHSSQPPPWLQGL